jgi:hypothetical protein
VKKAVLGGLAAAVAAVGIATVTPAHADAGGNYLTCLVRHGQTIYNANAAINLGYKIQADELNNLPRAQIIYNSSTTL